MKELFVVLVLGISLAGTSRADAEGASWQGWEKTGEKEGIVVYRKQIEGTSLLAFGGEGDVDAPVERVATAIFDTTRSPEWIEDLEESRILRWLGTFEYIEYNHVGTPFILKDRDFVSRVRVGVSPDKKQVSFHYAGAEDKELPTGRYVRGDITGSLFLLTSLGDGKRTHVHGEIHCDPRGSVPKWIVNFFQKDWPVDTFRNLRRHVVKPDVHDAPKILEFLK